MRQSWPAGGKKEAVVFSCQIQNQEFPNEKRENGGQKYAIWQQMGYLKKLTGI